MQRILISTLLFTILFFFASCDETTQDAETDPEALEFSVEPTEDLSFIVNEAHEDFTWKYFEDNVRVMGPTPYPYYSFELVLSSFQVRNGEVVNRNASDPVETNTDELAEGVSTEELSLGSGWMSGKTWVQGIRGSLVSKWAPEDATWFPSKIEEIALNEVDLSENQTMVVVYAKLAESSSDREVSTQPYGLIFSEEASTGSLEVTTETSGANQDEDYEVSVSDQTENIGANETITIPDIAAGNQDVELTGIADNCSVVNGDNPRTVTINADQTTSTTFEVNCAESLSGQLAFTSFRDGNANIHTITEDGSTVTQLTTNGSFDGQAAISPNGTKIAFTSERDGNREIYVMNSDGSSLTRLTNNSVLDEFPDWSPDGSQLVFSSRRDGVDDIYIMDADGSNVTKVTTDPEVDSHPSWSPDGSKIAFESLRDGDWNIYTINTDGSNPSALTGGDDAVSDRDPEWSPDGSQIAYSSNSDGDNELFVMDGDGDNKTQITSNDASDILPTWSPNGDFIGFQSDREGGNNIHIIGSDGSSPSRLTTSGAFDESPNWSPVEE